MLRILGRKDEETYKLWGKNADLQQQDWPPLSQHGLGHQSLWKSIIVESSEDQLDIKAMNFRLDDLEFQFRLKDLVQVP